MPGSFSPAASLTLATQIRYIKLGPAGCWAKRSLDAGQIHFGYKSVSHELACRADRQALVEFFIKRGDSPGQGKSFAREVMDFYTLGPDAIWITFENGYLWWARAHPEVTWLGEGESHGARMRRTIGPWLNVDSNGKLLVKDELSTKLTRVAAYRRTICKVEAADYLLRKLDGIEEPKRAAALAAKAQVVTQAAQLIGDLHEVDFETLVDIIFGREGWRRVSRIGGTQKDADLIVEQTVTRETAFVQVKSRATQAVLDGYVARFDDNGKWTRMIFACHSPRGRLDTRGRDDIIVWDREDLAHAAIKNGLFDWLVDRIT